MIKASKALKLDMGAAPEGPECLDGAGTEDPLVVEGGNGGSDEGSDPEHPLVIPCLLLVVYHGGSQTPRRVNSGSGHRNCGQVNHEHSKPNWKRCQNLLKKPLDN